MNRPYSSGKIDVSVVVPAHNEEANIGPLLEQFGELARRVRFGIEVIVVNDGSTDRTLPRLVDAQRVHRFLRVVSIPHRRGLTEALQSGFGAAQGGIVVFYPADRQFHPNDIPRMVDKVREGYDLVTGRKIGLYNKRVVSGAYSRISRWLFPSIPVTDLNSVKAFRREMIEVFDYRHDWHRFWVAIVAEQGYRVAEVDVTLYPRPAGKSKFGFWRIPGGVLDLLAVKFQYHTMRRPLWYFGMTGSILLLVGFVLGLLALYQRFVLKNAFRPLLYLVMMLGISGVVFFALGFLAESVAGIRQQVESLKGRPKSRLYHPAPPGQTASQISSLPAAETHPQSKESESRGSSGPSRERHPGRADQRSRRPTERRGAQRRRRGPDTRESYPASDRSADSSKPSAEKPSVPEVVDAGPAEMSAVAETPVLLNLDHSHGDERVERENPVEDSSTGVGDTALREARELPEPAVNVESESHTAEPDSENPAAPEKRSQYGRRNRP